MKSAWIDWKRRSGSESRPMLLEGEYVEAGPPGEGFVRVALGGVDNVVNVPSGGGAFVRGGRVFVQVDGDGRPIGVLDSAAPPADGETVDYVGAAGEVSQRLLGWMPSIEEGIKQAREAVDRVRSSFVSWSESERDARSGEIREAVDAAKAELAEANRALGAKVDEADRALSARVVAVDAKASTGAVSTDRLQAGSSLISGGLLRPGAIGAREITASAGLWAKIGTFAKITTQMLVAGGAKIGGDLLAETIRLTTKIIAGNPDGTHTLLDPHGVRVFRKQRDGSSTEVVRLGAGEADYIGVSDPDGRVLASINEGGYAVFQGLAVNGSLRYGGKELGSTIDTKVSGIVGWGAGWPWDGQPIHRLMGEESLFDLTVPLKADRLYAFSTHFAWKSEHSDAACEVRIRYESAGVGQTPRSPDRNSTPFTALRFSGMKQGQSRTEAAGRFKVWSPPNDGVYRFLFSGAYAYVVNGCSLDYSLQPPVLLVEDLGPVQPQMTNINKSIAPVAPSSPSAVQRFNKHYEASWGQSYTIGGGRYDYMGNVAMQGSYGGRNHASMIGFPDMTSDLHGANIEAMAVYLHFRHWYGQTGAARIGIHGSRSAPSSYSDLNGFLDIQPSWGRGEGRWIAVPQKYWRGFQDGTYRGITLRAPDGSLAYYGYADIQSAKLSVVYSK